MKLFDILDKNLENGDNKQDKVKLIDESNLMIEKKPVEKIVEKQETYETTIGLTSSQAQNLLNRNGKNELVHKNAISPMSIFFGQFKDIMTLILLICTLISVFMGEYVEALTIAAIVLMNGILGFIQEFKTEKTLEALKNMAAPLANVYRNNKIVQVPANELVCGDVVMIEEGDKIPADGVVLESISLECNESMLTGESKSVKKKPCLSPNDKKNELNQKDMVYMGCIATRGRGKFLVKSTGMLTQMGHIANMLNDIKDEQTPLQKKLQQLGKFIAVGCLIVCAIVTVTGILRGEPLFDMLITGISLAVAAVPEGLPAIVTISLALSVSRMVKRQALVRKLHAVETLGCASVICSDKTGTLTQNKMSVTTTYMLDKNISSEKLNVELPETKTLMEAICCCNNSQIYNEGKTFGDATEVALLEFAKKYNFTRQQVDSAYKRVSENPFDSTRKCMSVVCKKSDGQKVMFVKGAYDVILQKCNRCITTNGIENTFYTQSQNINQANEKMAEEALRVIGIAYKPLSVNDDINQESDLIFIGLVGMMDPPRKEVKDAVNLCYKAGIKTIMITGDHKVTAKAIAKKIGIYHSGDMIITGQELEQMSFEKLVEVVNKTTVFARVSPNHKLNIVKALKRNGHIVAMTGDGVNDAPAIKEADIGVSMGINGTDVTKEASEIILLDDNFATLVNAVEEGRSIYNNIRKFIRYLLSCNIGEVVTMFLGMLMGMPIILFPIQILLVNLVTDGLPAIALGLEPSERSSMLRKPRGSDESIFAHGLAWTIIFRGILIGLATLASFVALYTISKSEDVARTGALVALIFAQLIHVFECKSEEKSIININYFNNIKLLLAVLLSLAVLLGVVYVPTLQTLFSTVTLTFKQILIPIGFCMIAPILNIFVLRRKIKNEGNNQHN